MDKNATRTSWKAIPIDKPHPIKISLHFSEEEFTKLNRGLIPRQMEDKWFIFYEDGWLYFHRSWTGFGNYKAQLMKEENGYSIKEFWVERNQKKYTNLDDDKDVEDFKFLIFRGLLEVDVRDEYSKKVIKNETDSLRGWSDFGQLLFSGYGFDYTAHIKSALFGIAIGDALGVPVEFESREKLARWPVKNMQGDGTHSQPSGTWSDDTSLTLCLAQAITDGFSLQAVADNLIKWHNEGYWTPHGVVFDIGNTTAKAILRLKQDSSPELAGETDEYSNGNGSLMRILPLVFHLMEKSVEERWEITRQVCSITHAHIRSVIACFYYLELARQILNGADGIKAYRLTCRSVKQYLNECSIPQSEIELFGRVLYEEIDTLQENEIRSDGYVLHTLEASLWCMLSTDNYKDAVLKAVNLGGDTDTTGAVTGGLAGLLYGYESIPTAWTKKIAKRKDIEELSERFGNRINGNL
jgi:ADP-ribosyl-[dinitrogen reductase] hydrolase